jgi:hypothetical protein
MYAFHASLCMPGVRFLRVVPYVATFHESVIELDIVTAHEKKGSRHNSQHTDWPIYGSIPSFSSEPTNEAVEKAKTSINSKLLGLPSPYHRHAIGTFTTCSWGPTHQSLTDTGGGYNLRGAGFRRTTPWPSQPSVSPFHLRALDWCWLRWLRTSLLRVIYRKYASMSH